MVIKEFYMTAQSGINLYRNYSDKNLKLRQIETGAIYDEAIDIEGAPYTYEETDELIEVEEPEDLKEEFNEYDN